MKSNRLISMNRSSVLLCRWFLVVLLSGCSLPATFEGMVPTAFETVHAHPQSVSVNVTGGQESVALGRPQITNGAFAQALVTSILKSRTFAKVIDEKTLDGDFLLTVTLFSMDKLVFGTRSH